MTCDKSGQRASEDAVGKRAKSVVTQNYKKWVKSWSDKMLRISEMVEL